MLFSLEIEKMVFDVCDFYTNSCFLTKQNNLFHGKNQNNDYQ